MYIYMYICPSLHQSIARLNIADYKADLDLEALRAEHEERVASGAHGTGGGGGGGGYGGGYGGGGGG